MGTFIDQFASSRTLFAIAANALQINPLYEVYATVSTRKESYQPLIWKSTPVPPIGKTDLWQVDKTMQSKRRHRQNPPHHRTTMSRIRLWPISTECFCIRWPNRSCCGRNCPIQRTHLPQWDSVF